ncbi:hypothetical protein [Nocardioides phosphati]|uniref:hypothetical protein n=1 Tax=Nocardioides phosphati TaxID=1867775 RepID=UPI001662DD01|nr:hypothetical protein [Nocardioides phosphati]
MDDRQRSYGVALLVASLAYASLHHLGLLPAWDGPSGTRWNDWLDLLVPWLVLGPAAWVLVAAAASPRAWLAFAAGALLYASGHGIHLAANSIGNVAPGETAHLWDEEVGHLVWYAGAAVVGGAVAGTMRGRRLPTGAGLLLGLAAGAAVGTTWATNALGGGSLVLAVVVALAACAFGWHERRSLGRLVGAAGVAALGVLLAGLAAALRA